MVSTSRRLSERYSSYVWGHTSLRVRSRMALQTQGACCYRSRHMPHIGATCAGAVCGTGLSIHAYGPWATRARAQCTPSGAASRHRDSHRRCGNHTAVHRMRYGYGFCFCHGTCFVSGSTGDGFWGAELPHAAALCSTHCIATTKTLRELCVLCVCQKA